MSIYKRHRLRPEISSYAAGLYYRFSLSLRRCAGPLIEDLLAGRWITVSREAIRRWRNKFGSLHARNMQRQHRGYGYTFFTDDVFLRINGGQHYPWQAVDQDGEVLDVHLQARRDGTAAKQLFGRLLRSHGAEPRRIVTDKLRSYGVAHPELIPESIPDSSQYANNRACHSHQPAGVRERGMRRFKLVRQAQRVVTAQAVVSNLFNFGRHLAGAQRYRILGISAFDDWSRAVV